MHKKYSAALLLAGFIASSIALGAGTDATITQEELVRRTQPFAGDRAVAATDFDSVNAALSLEAE